MKTDNELIAEFMGGVRGTGDCDDLWYFGDPDKPHKYLRYQTSWDTLMPVVENIKNQVVAFEISMSLGTVVRICHGEKIKYSWIVIEDNYPIQAVYKGCVDFIKWHNEQNGVI